MFQGFLSPAGGYLLLSEELYREFTISNHSHVIKIIYSVLELSVQMVLWDLSYICMLHVLSLCFIPKLPCIDYSGISTNFSGPH